MKKLDLSIKVDDNEKERLDVFLTKYIEEYSRSFIQKLIKNGQVLVDNCLKTSSYKVNLGDLITIEIEEDEKEELVFQDIPLDILYEDAYLLVVNKKRGMVVHPGAGNTKDTLVNALLYHTKGKLSRGFSLDRPGIVHRIDKDTSGLLVVAKDDLTQDILAQDFFDRKVKREYIAIVKGYLENAKASISAPIGRNKINRLKMQVEGENAKEAITDYMVIEELSGACLVKANLQTGRTHQIRVHMAYLNRPVLGDDLYGGKDKRFNKGQLLHAQKIGFIHPIEKTYMEFEKEADKYFLHAWESLKIDKE